MWCTKLVLPKSLCTEMDHHCIEVDMYWSGRPQCTEMDMYEMFPPPFFHLETTSHVTSQRLFDNPVLLQHFKMLWFILFSLGIPWCVEFQNIRHCGLNLSQGAWQCCGQAAAATTEAAHHNSSSSMNFLLLKLSLNHHHLHLQPSSSHVCGIYKFATETLSCLQ